MYLEEIANVCFIECGRMWLYKVGKFLVMEFTCKTLQLFFAIKSFLKLYTYSNRAALSTSITILVALLPAALLRLWDWEINVSTYTGCLAFTPQIPRFIVRFFKMRGNYVKRNYSKSVITILFLVWLFRHYDIFAKIVNRFSLYHV